MYFSSQPCLIRGLHGSIIRSVLRYLSINQIVQLWFEITFPFIFWSPYDPHGLPWLLRNKATSQPRSGAGDKYTLQVDPDLRIGPCAEGTGLKGIIEDRAVVGGEVPRGRSHRKRW